ncbi:WbqC-like protein family-domain-containing protein [Russula earlei]|uniref:WbqC-like protein family-domain-containing protein n=1 Tax=Russula earlei TaxID=71964 RepID=A0ACC0TQM3_9AGAM|nr:WbqC-like protein family-domain-containing protein [Russula earlei]
MSTLVIENQYFGCVNWTSALFTHTDVKIEQCENYQKMSFRNRCVIGGSNGLIHLTIPVQGGRDKKQLLKDTRIDNRERWQQQHWRSIFSCYGRSPFFEFYRDGIEQFFTKEYVFLNDLNTGILHWLVKVLKIPAHISATESYQLHYPPEVHDYRNRWLPKNFQQQEAAITYNQVFGNETGFQPNLSVLDILCCEGPETANIIKI